MRNGVFAVMPDPEIVRLVFVIGFVTGALAVALIGWAAALWRRPMRCALRREMDR